MTDGPTEGEVRTAVAQAPSEEPKPARAARLFISRWRELILPTTEVGRRSRTLSALAALDEAADLAASYVRSHGVTSSAASPQFAGHGIATLSEVVAETVQLLSLDPVLRRRRPTITDLVRATLSRIGTDAPPKQSDVHDLTTTAALIRKTYVADAFVLVSELASQRPKELKQIERICECLVPELRNRGFTDATLLELLDLSLQRAHLDALAAIDELRAQVDLPTREWTCYVGVAADRLWRHLDGHPGLTRAPLPSVPHGRPVAHSDHLRLLVRSVDRRHAAAAAKTRVDSILGAAAVFMGDPMVASPIVVVDSSSGLEAIDTNDSLRREHRSTSGDDQLKRILSSAWLSGNDGVSNAVLDAIRHHERAMSTYDSENRFILLWFGIERLVVGTTDYSTILSSARNIIPPCICLAKVRRDVSALTTALIRRARKGLPSAMRQRLRALLTGDGSHRPERQLLERLLGSDDSARELLATFYDHDPRLVQWFTRVRESLGRGSGQVIAQYLDESRQRIEWQILRLYRARTNLAHAASGPAWLRDLIRHAHHYLTQLIAIVLHYQDLEPQKLASDILLRRARQYAVFLELLRANDRSVADPAVLLDPVRLLRE